MEIWIGIGAVIILQIIVLIQLRQVNDGKKDIVNNTQNSVNALGMMLNENQRNQQDMVNARIREMNESVHQIQQLSLAQNELVRKQLLDTTHTLEDKMNDLTMQNDTKMEILRQTIENKMTALQQDNAKQLESMRQTVDEKLQDTLEKRISKSFQVVSDRLEQVYKGLGEMQTLANGVGDLKKVLSNVKTRGILGEIQLGAILEEILAPEQYEENVVTKKGSSNRVEFAVKLPGNDDAVVYLPIDSKFPGDKYAQLLDAYDNGNQAEIQSALKELETVIRKSAKDIHDKYIDVPNTTEFAIMFLPFEGLYAEVVRNGYIEMLQREYKINIAGPTTMAALLNSLQMGFRTLAIQKRSSEVWQILSAVKTEFNKFGTVLEATQNKLNQAQKELDTLVGVRTRQIQKKLDAISLLDQQEQLTQDFTIEHSID